MGDLAPLSGLILIKLTDYSLIAQYVNKKKKENMGCKGSKVQVFMKENVFSH